ncbi:potassium channel family protein [Ornithinicoccus halotolerans]|uniref:potassium channel family protein n=1 Tax=Ornithinicoccus halotolerans TaxID=1748220 RepID=UPI001297C611|nr:potassium channel family protein [Ornithinicoccus halotolerans]
MAALLTLVGAGLILAALRDIFHTLWHPRGFGTLARSVFTLVWRTSRVLHRLTGRSSELTGPVGLLLTVLCWGAMMVLGWALVYLPQLPGSFHYSASIDESASSGLVTALYLSLVTVATLGFGDIVPASDVLRLLTPVQALVGFVLLTAAIAWVLQVYPALARRRGLARLLTAMNRTSTTDVVRQGDPAVSCQILHEVATALAGVEVDMMQYAESYFFRESDLRHSLAASAPYVLDLVHAGRSSTSPEVRHGADMLLNITIGLANTLVRNYLPATGRDESTAAVLKAWAEDHQQGELREQRGA